MESKSSSYTKLSETTPNKSSKYNIAGIVIDATQPYKTSRTFIVTLKIVDPSICLFSEENMMVDADQSAKNKDEKMYRSISVFNDNNNNEMPIVRNIGDIILLRNCQCLKYKENDQFNVNIHWHSGYMLFDSKEPTDEELKEKPGRQFVPYKMKLQDHEFALTIEEKLLITNLRYWSNNDFASSFVYPETMFDSCAIVSKQARECDLHCKILEIRKDNDMIYEICLADQSRCKLFLRVSKNIIKQWDIQNDDIVRVRSIISKCGTSNYIELKQTSNFIKFPKESRIYQEIETKLKDDHAISVLMESSNDELILEHPITVTKTSERYNSLKFCTFKELFHDKNSDSYAINYSNYYDESGNSLQSTKIRVKFCILRIDPEDIKEFVQIFCFDCNTTTSLKKYGENTMSNYKCSQCDDDTKTELIYQIQFLAKDESTEDTDFVHRVLLYSIGGKCSSFFADINPTNLYSNYKVLANISKLVNLITKFNVYIESIVELKYQEKESPFLLMHDCKLHATFLSNKIE